MTSKGYPRHRLHSNFENALLVKDEDNTPPSADAEDVTAGYIVLVRAGTEMPLWIVWKSRLTAQGIPYSGVN